MAGTKLPASTYLPLWLAALEEEIGIVIMTTTEGRHKLVNTLYECRKQSINPALQELMVFTPTEDMICIARKSTEIDDLAR